MTNENLSDLIKLMFRANGNNTLDLKIPEDIDILLELGGVFENLTGNMVCLEVFNDKSWCLVSTEGDRCIFVSSPD